MHTDLYNFWELNSLKVSFRWYLLIFWSYSLLEVLISSHTVVDRGPRILDPYGDSELNSDPDPKPRIFMNENLYWKLNSKFPDI